VEKQKARHKEEREAREVKTQNQLAHRAENAEIHAAAWAQRKKEENDAVTVIAILSVIITVCLVCYHSWCGPPHA